MTLTTVLLSGHPDRNKFFTPVEKRSISGFLGPGHRFKSCLEYPGKTGHCRTRKQDFSLVILLNEHYLRIRYAEPLTVRVKPYCENHRYAFGTHPMSRDALA